MNCLLISTNLTYKMWIFLNMPHSRKHSLVITLFQREINNKRCILPINFSDIPFLHITSSASLLSCKEISCKVLERDIFFDARLHQLVSLV